jgi:hypothetical protein
VFDYSLLWQIMLCLSCDTTEEVEQLADSQYLSIAAFRSGSALLEVPKISESKNLVTNMAGLVAVSPFKHVPRVLWSMHLQRR